MATTTHNALAPAESLAADTANAVEQQPVPIKIVNPTSSPDPGWAIGGAIVGALLGAIVAQTLAYKLAAKTRKRDDRSKAFEHVYLLGIQTRRQVSRYRASIRDDNHKEQVDRWDAFATALWEFRAAELAFRARFGDDDAAGAEFAAARDALAAFALPELSDEEAEERWMEYLEEEAELGGAAGRRLDQREELRLAGKAMEDALERAAAAFGAEHR